jgi:hypothetical protein
MGSNVFLIDSFKKIQKIASHKTLPVSYDEILSHKFVQLDQSSLTTKELSAKMQFEIRLFKNALV